ncbi:hypothetical protein Patl1_13281 [Pistacia atlantica]|uniref:Uncharacterized protein n=1 Tax=Pistacia atlantica TaxID=434234 RepID=A0ACC1AWS8_9ROSI|nr:hypothetical protein Patl1_13281 [Pistacia atlantica]
MAVLQIERFWQEANMDMDIQSMLSKPPVINGFVEILFNSVDPRVLKATVFLLSELGSRDKSVIQTLTRVESDVECIVALFKKGLHEAVVLIYLLRPSTMTLIEMDMMKALLNVIKKKDEDLLKMCLKQKSASVLLLGQIIGKHLEAELAEERIAAVGILLRCMHEDGKCRNTIAEKAVLAPVLESFMAAIANFMVNLGIMPVWVDFNVRFSLGEQFNEQILHIIKDEGTFSTMHTLLVYLQTANEDQCPVVAGLLLQLDLLAEPRKMSIYREEAIDTLISCLRNSDFPAAQIAAAETIMSLQGRFTFSGKPLTRAILLKRAGLARGYRSLIRTERLGSISGEIDDTSEEEKAADDWERKMAFVLASHEFGLVFEALAEGLKSRYAKLSSACLESAAWLVYMLRLMPDTGIQGAARVCLLQRFVSIFKSVKDTDDKALSLLALNSFIHDPEGMVYLSPHMKDIMKGLREFRKSCPLAVEMLKVFSEGHESSADFWNHKELVQLDSSENGEVLSIACFRDKIFSGHSDGTIKVWTGRGSILHLIQEIREHTKAVTGLAVLQSEERLYSGSLDKTARVWSIGNEEIHCVQVQDTKDQVHSLVVASSILCFIPQGAGVKVHSWTGGSKLLNSSKNVKCLALLQGKLYCGCHDSSIQEIDLATGTLGTIQIGSRKLLGKANPIHALQVHNGLIYSASSGLDGAVVKIWSASNYAMVGSLPTTCEVRAMVVSSELVYLGCKGGAVEIWDSKKQTKIETLQTATNGKVLCMALDDNEEVLVIGTSDGRIQVFYLFHLNLQRRTEFLLLSCMGAELENVDAGRLITDFVVLSINMENVKRIVAEVKMESSLNENMIQQSSRPKKGGFRTMPFIIVNESFEKVAGYGLMPNMIFYLMNGYHIATANGATMLAMWSATSNALAIVGAFLSDSYIGRFSAILLGSFSSLLGTTLLWLTAMVPQLKPPLCTQFSSNCESATPAQLFVLLTSFGLISIGAGCIRPCSMAFGADQLDKKGNPNNERIIQSFFNWYYASIGVSTFLALTLIIYIQDQLGWKVGFGVPALLMVFSTLMFLMGSNLYVKVKVEKSLFTGFIQVIVAALRKRNLNIPDNNLEYYQGLDTNIYITPTDKLRFLNKACIIENSEDLKPGWDSFKSMETQQHRPSRIT